MSRRMFSWGLTCAAVLSFGMPDAPIARAGEISTYRWVLEAYAQPAGIGGANFFLLVGPTGGTVVNTRIIAEFVTADAWDVSNLHIQMFAPILQPDGTTGAELDVYGTDFGWSGVGRFEVTYNTSVLNGPISAPNNVSLWPLDLNEFGNFYFGRYLKLRIELTVEDIVADAFCSGDLDGNGLINGTDLSHFEEGPCPANGDPCPADINFDGVVTREDRDLLITLLGGVCPYVP